MKEGKAKEELTATEEQAKAYYSLVIESTADKVWEAVRDFKDTRSMGEGVNYRSVPNESGKIDENLRSATTERGQLHENLLVQSDDDHFYTYNYADGGPDNVNDFQASIRVIPTEESNNAYVEWTATFTCPELEKATW